MKTSEEILIKHCPFKNVTGNREYFTKEVLEAMEEYRNQSPQGTVYVPVKCSERLPEIANENYITISERGMKTGRFFNGQRFESAYYDGEITHWLEETTLPIPDIAGKEGQKEMTHEILIQIFKKVSLIGLSEAKFITGIDNGELWVNAEIKGRVVDSITYDGKIFYAMNNDGTFSPLSNQREAENEWSLIAVEQPPTNFIQQAFESFPENSITEVQCAGSKTTTLFLNVRNDKQSLLITIKELRERLDAMSGVTPIKILDAGNPLEDKYYGPGYFSPAKPKNNE